MEKVKVLVVEDEIIIADNIVDALEEFGYFAYEPVTSFTEAIESINEDKPDIAILDIQLSGKKNGIDLAQKINEEYHFPIIFLSSNSDKITLQDAKKVEPFAYLVKPFIKEELYTSIEVALYNYSKQKENALDQENLIIENALFIKQDKLFLRLDFDNIIYLKSDHIYINIHTKNQKVYSVRGSLNTYMGKLASTFIRTNRSHIANLTYLEAIELNHLVVDGQDIPIGKKQREDVLLKLNKG